MVCGRRQRVSRFLLSRPLHFSFKLNRSSLTLFTWCCCFFFRFPIFTILHEELKQNQASSHAVKGKKVFPPLSSLSILLVLVHTLSLSLTHSLLVRSLSLACQFKTFKFLTPCTREGFSFCWLTCLSFMHKLFSRLRNINDFHSFSFCWIEKSTHTLRSQFARRGATPFNLLFVDVFVVIKVLLLLMAFYLLEIIIIIYKF